MSWEEYARGLTITELAEGLIIYVIPFMLFSLLLLVGLPASVGFLLRMVFRKASSRVLRAWIGLSFVSLFCALFPVAIFELYSKFSEGFSEIFIERGYPLVIPRLIAMLIVGLSILFWVKGLAWFASLGVKLADKIIGSRQSTRNAQQPIEPAVS